MVEKAKHQGKRSDSFSTPSDKPWRGAYLYLHEKQAKRGNGTPLATPRFAFTLVIPKLGPAETCPNYAAIAGLAMQAATRDWGRWPDGGFWPIQDGDIPFTPKAPAPGQPIPVVDPMKYAWRKGNWIIECTNYSKEGGPTVAVLENGRVVQIPARVFNGRTYYKSGDFVVANIHCYSFFHEKWGVNFGFDGIMFVAEGEAIGSGGGPKSAAEMFAGVQAPAGMKPMGTSSGHPNAPGPGTGGGPIYTGPVQGGPALPPLPAAPVAMAAPPVQSAAPAPSYTPMPPPNMAAPAPVLPPFPR